MEAQQLAKFLKIMKKTAHEAGEHAIKHQQGVIDLSKEDAEKFNTDTEFILKQKSAKTIIDDQIQEILLKAAITVLDPQKTFVDAEEKTPSLDLFSKNPDDLTLVLDPIDGTLEYIQGTGDYNVCIGLFHQGQLLTIIVHYPARDHMYFVENGQAYLESAGKIEKLTTPSAGSKIIYGNNRVSADIVKKLQNLGYEFLTDAEGLLTWPEALLKCLSGEIKLCFFKTPQLRDIFLGAIISKMPTGFAHDWQGDNVNWSQGSRVVEIVFGFGELDPKILSIVK